MKKFKLLILLVFPMLTSCVNVKDVRYLQPNENLVLNSEGLISYDNMPKYRVTKHDILKLNIITTQKEMLHNFTLVFMLSKVIVG